MRHVCFLVDDHGSAHSLSFRDPDGNVVELTRYLLQIPRSGEQDRRRSDVIYSRTHEFDRGDSEA